MTKNTHAPYVHTDKTNLSKGTEWAVALLPVLIWSVYMFGARVITLCVICSSLSIGLDYCVKRFLFKEGAKALPDIMAAIYGILAVFSMPVTVSFWVPMLAAVLIVLAKNIRVFRAKRLFNPFVFAAAVLQLCFRTQMTTFTRPFAYFSAFSFSIDERLIQGYRVISPLQYMADGSVYEDGVLAQLYGYASGNLGEIAVTAMAISLIWLCLRKEADWRGTVALLAPILLLALMFPSDDAESNYYAYSVILSGATVFLSVFATNESHTVPVTRAGRIIFGAVCGTLIFVLRKVGNGIEWSYCVILLMNVASPFIEKLTKPRVLGIEKKKK